MQVPNRCMHVFLSQELLRVVCTGYGNGGAEAELCGIWAAVTYPAAQIRSIAFGAPAVCSCCEAPLDSHGRTVTCEL